MQNSRRKIENRGVRVKTCGFPRTSRLPFPFLFSPPKGEGEGAAKPLTPNPMKTNTLSSPPRDEQNPQTALRVRFATPPNPLLHAGGETAMSISKKRKEIFPLIALEGLRNALF